MENHNLNITTLETQVLTELIQGLYAEPGFSDVSDADLVRQTGIPAKSIRGVLGSLTKKGIIFQLTARELGIDDPYCDFKTIVYLDDAHHNLHPEWKQHI